jgi:hypothetical protein
MKTRDSRLIMEAYTDSSDTLSIYENRLKEAIDQYLDSNNIILSEEQQRKFLQESFSAVSSFASKALPVAGLALMIPQLWRAFGPKPDEEEVEETAVQEDEVLDAEKGESLVTVLQGIKNKIADIEDGKLLISRNNLLNVIEEIGSDIDQILGSIEYNSSADDD